VLNGVRFVAKEFKNLAHVQFPYDSARRVRQEQILSSYPFQ
jgi:hypothetical protein